MGPGAANEKYFVYVLNLSGGSVWIGQEKARQETWACRFGGGGPCEGAGKSPPAIIRQSAPFNTYDAAKTAWCQDLAGKKTYYSAVAGDTKGEVYGGAYWLGLAPSCG